MDPRPHASMLKKFKCPQCPESYDSPRGLGNHKKMHNSGKKFICSDCKYGCNNARNLKSHCRTHRTSRRAVPTSDNDTPALRRANAEHELRPNDEHETESSDVDEDEYVVESDDDIPAVETNAVVERNPAPTFVWKKVGQKVPLTGLVRCQTDVDTGKDNAHAAPTATTSSSATTSTAGIYVASATERRSDANSFRVKTAATSNSQSTASAARTAIVSVVSDKVPAWLNHDDMLNLVVRAGQTAEWKVKFGGKPAPKVAWSKNQQPINPKTSEPIQVHTKTNDHTTLRIPATTRADCGAFTLLVRNSKGMDTVTAVLTVLGKPSKPRVPLEVNDVTEDGCVLRWTAPEDDGGLRIDHYEVEKLEGGKWVPCAKVSDCVAQVKELKKGQQYQFRVKAVNKEGKSEKLCTEHEIVTKNQYADPGKNPNATDSVTVTIAVKSRHRPTTPKGPRPLAPGKVEKPSVTDWDKDHVHLEWQPPANDGGAELKEYVVEKKDATTGKWVEAIRVAADQTKANVPGLREGEQYQVATYQKTKAIVKGLEEGKEYQFRVKAVNKSGPGLPSEPCEKVVTERIDLDALLKFCHQDDVVLTWKSFGELSSFGTWSKIGEGAFGEVFKGLLENAFTAFKVIPFAENEQQCRKKVNGDNLKPAKFIFNELFITSELTKLSEDTGNGFVTPSFTQLRITKIVKGCFPRKLLSAWDAYKKANPELVENDRPSKYADKGQHFLIIGLSYGGKSLESYEIQSGPECYAIFQQIALSLAIAEDVLEFEHRDLHAGNILVEQCPANEKIRYLYRGEQIDVVSNGVRASIIDFSISRMTKKGGAFVFVDLCQNPGLFEQNGVSKGCDYQYDVYKLMKAVVSEKWAKFWPQTNVLWVGYVAKKLFANDFIKGKRKKAIEKLFSNFENNFATIHDFLAHPNFLSVFAEFTSGALSRNTVGAGDGGRSARCSQPDTTKPTCPGGQQRQQKQYDKRQRRGIRSNGIWFWLLWARSAAIWPSSFLCRISCAENVCTLFVFVLRCFDAIGHQDAVTILKDSERHGPVSAAALAPNLWRVDWRMLHILRRPWLFDHWVVTTHQSYLNYPVRLPPASPQTLPFCPTSCCPSCRCFFFADFSLFAGTLVMPLPDTLQARLFHMPKFRGFLKSALTERTNEIVWLQHMKFFVFDEHSSSQVPICPTFADRRLSTVDRLLRRPVPHRWRQSFRLPADERADFPPWEQLRRFIRRQCPFGRRHHHFLAASQPAAKNGDDDNPPAGVRADHRLFQTVRPYADFICTSTRAPFKIVFSSPQLSKAKIEELYKKYELKLEEFSGALPNSSLTCAAPAQITKARLSLVIVLRIFCDSTFLQNHHRTLEICFLGSTPLTFVVLFLLPTRASWFWSRPVENSAHFSLCIAPPFPNRTLDKKTEYFSDAKRIIDERGEGNDEQQLQQQLR
ncbi:hypothetical protein niasHT_002138 [Heterodera trifolii]|uniref:non-specific serine/threonine protein kinase n=1 Tax=Heterodera trifolii TaxID=157864 RepID=A0ABD2MFB6_9BILA